MDNNSDISSSTIISELLHKIKCHSSKQLFCRGDICFMEYTEITPMKTEYGCIILDKNIDHKCNKTMDFIHRECCSTTFCNSRLLNHDIYHRYNNRWSILNMSSINDNDLFHSRLQIIINIIMAILFFSLLCAIGIYLWKQRIERICKNIGQRTIRSRKVQPSLSPSIPVSAPKIPSFIDGDNSNSNIIHISTCSPISPFSIEEYSNDPPLNLTYHNNRKLSNII